MPNHASLSIAFVHLPFDCIRGFSKKPKKKNNNKNQAIYHSQQFLPRETNPKPGSLLILD